MYRRLGRLPARTFDAGVAAVAADVDVPTAARLLSTLKDLDLLQEAVTATASGTGIGGGRYRFHDAVRRHARERANEEEPAGSYRPFVRRVTAHYLALTALAGRALRRDRLRVADLDALLRDRPDPFTPGDGRDAVDPLDWLEAEHEAVLDTLREAARQGLYDQVWPLSEAFTVLFLHHRHLADWKESLELGAAAASAALEPAAEARLRSQLSRPLMDLGAYDAVRTELDKAAACAEVCGHTALRASVQECLGRYWERLDLARAMAAYRRSAELSTAAGEPGAAAAATYHLGRAQDAYGDHEAALDSLRSAHQVLLAHDDRHMAARALAAAGIAYGHLDRPDEAIRALEAAATALRAQRATHDEARTLVALADLAERTNTTADTVRAHLTRALELHEAVGHPAEAALRRRLHAPAPDAGADGGADGDDGTP